MGAAPVEITTGGVVEDDAVVVYFEKVEMVAVVPGTVTYGVDAVTVVETGTTTVV